MKISSYKDLIVWQKSMDLAELVYKFTDAFPKAEQYGITSQMRRSSVSTCSNITEGSRGGSRKDFRQFLIIAFASGAELETQILLAERLHCFVKSEFHQLYELLQEVMKMLNALIYKLQTTH